MKKQILIILTLFTALTIYAQNEEIIKYPEVGKPCPDFVLKDVQYYLRKQVNLGDFKGKWLIIDCWNEYCSGCIKTFPQYNELQHLFPDKIQFLLIGYNGSQYTLNRSSDKSIRVLFEKIRQKENLQLPIAYDSILFHRFGILSCPYVIIVDDKGIVRGLTYSLTSENIKDFLAGKPSILGKVHRKNESEDTYEREIPFLIHGNGGDDLDFLYRSLLAKWKPSMPRINPGSIFSPSKEGRFEIFGADLNLLYRYAYFGRSGWNWIDTGLYGKFSFSLILETHDSSLFQFDNSWLLDGRNLYCYSLIVPFFKFNKEYLMKMMQNDLRNYFGYDISIESREMPYWKLVATEEAKNKLKTKGDFFFNGSPNQGFIAKNIPVKSVISLLWATNTNGPPFIDETGILGNIDLTMYAIESDFEDVKRALHERGLDLIKSVKEMQVLVVRDKK